MSILEEPDYGECEHCGGKLKAEWFREEEFYPQTATKTGRWRLNVNYLYCPVCMRMKPVDNDTFARGWH